MKPLTTLLLLFTVFYSFGQDVEFKVLQIDSIAKEIDSKKGLKSAISEGKISLKGKKRKKGGYSDWFYVDTTSNKLVKVIHEQSLGYYDFDVYYFMNNTLILTTTSRMKTINNKDLITSTGRYYFENGELIHRKEENKYAKFPEAFVNTSTIYLEEKEDLFSLFQK
jgi:hypothetical protein